MSGKTVIVTGASSGIGYAIARAFLAEGDNVLMNGRNEEKLRHAAERAGRPEKTEILASDVTCPKSAERIVAAAARRFGSVDTLINNAGIFEIKPFTDYTLEDLDGYLGYLRGTYLLTQSAVRRMREQGEGGAIVNIGTILALNGVHGMPSSAPIAAKGGITALTKNLSIELAGDKIRINAVAPGIVPTPLYGELSEEELSALAAMQPLGRYGTPDDIAEAVVYLANAEWVTGVILPVDGGVNAGGDGVCHASGEAARSAEAFA